MLAKTHRQAGYTCMLTTFPMFIQYSTTPQILPYVINLIGISFGVLLTDIDSTNSTISRKIPLRRLFGKNRGAAHRTWVHTLFFIMIYTIISLLIGVMYIKSISPYFYYLFYCFTMGVNLGMFSHLCLDTLNPTGIAWLYPLSKKKFHIIGIYTECYLEDKHGKKRKTKGESRIRNLLIFINIILLLRIVFHYFI